MPDPDIFFSFFMFTADLRPEDPASAAAIARHMGALRDMGYGGFDLPIAPRPTVDHAAEVDGYRRLRDGLDAAGLAEVGISTNVGATQAFDPTSPDRGQRDAALAYLKSRVDITRALGGSLLAGPILFPYGVFPKGASGDPVWSDALQDWLAPRYRAALPVLEALADHAEASGVRLAIEPVDHWETPGPNLVAEVLDVVERIANRTLGLCVDSAHVVLGSEGPDAVRAGMARAIARGRLHAVHVSAPDRGAVHDSWIPWRAFLGPIAAHYRGPYLVEVFNAVPPFLGSLRQTRRKFRIPGEDPPGAGPSAYDVAAAALATLRAELRRAAA